MGKIKEIQKSRKECKCGKCGNIIPVGSKYLRGILNFHPDIIRCKNCGLKYWEVTTSDYVQRVAPILNEWQEQGYSYEDILSEFTDLKDELQERLDNMPESLQDSDSGQTLQDRIDGLEEACSQLEEISRDDIFSEKLEELIDREDATADNLTEEEQETVNTATDEEIVSLVDEALQSVIE